jgi:hypothetical protein
MPRKSMKKMMKELMAKKKLTAKEKKLLMRMQKGGAFSFFNPSTWFSSDSSTTTPVDQATLAKQFDELKGQICKVCKAALGEGCKCGNTAPPSEPDSNSGNVPVTEKQETPPSGEGDLAIKESMSPMEEPMDDTQSEKKTSGGKGKSMKRKMKRSRRTSKKMKF